MESAEVFTPSVDLTIFPRVNYYTTFEERFDARADNGRIFMSGDPTVPLAIADGLGANWLGTNVYEIGQTVEGKTAEFTGGKEPVTYRYRFQTKAVGSDTWVSGPWTNTTNAKNPVFYTITQAGELKLQSQARDASDPIKTVSSNTGVKTVSQLTIGDVTIEPDNTSSAPGAIVSFTVTWDGDARNALPMWSIRSGPAIIYSSSNMQTTVEIQVNPDATNGESIQVQCDLVDSNASDSAKSAVSMVIISSSGP